MQELVGIPYNEFDYQVLMSALSDYRYPRDRVTRLIDKGLIIGVKKGIYVFSEQMGRGPYSREILANMIYDPSYISLEYALAHYQLIPEHVSVITSVTLGKNRKFTTAVGHFNYRHLRNQYYYRGIQTESFDGRQYLIASPEKALIDQLYFMEHLGSMQTLAEYLFKDLRIDEAEFMAMDHDKLLDLAAIYRHPNLTVLRRYIRRLP
ncbi:MAG: hypothetical protein Q7J65_01345 [Candidatus Marinimicrobia bacterium]|nr:hypothetical protein [Candidatus Neomarinimicrobiota bacterium]